MGFGGDLQGDAELQPQEALVVLGSGSTSKPWWLAEHIPKVTARKDTAVATSLHR